MAYIKVKGGSKGHKNDAWSTRPGEDFEYLEFIHSMNLSWILIKIPDVLVG